ncbi:MAG TPA: hypothetical protein VFO34_11015 [Candidatus Acidoferrales bacterium]|nr:hypothetical protein [Candidatus Acidoferrales bacterium]
MKERDADVGEDAAFFARNAILRNELEETRERGANLIGVREAPRLGKKLLRDFASALRFVVFLVPMVRVAIAEARSSGASVRAILPLTCVKGTAIGDVAENVRFHP